ALGLLGGVILTTTLWAQEGPGAPWRGAGSQPCFGPEGGSYQCRQAPGLVAVRAGRLFDSGTGRMLTDQVVLILNERITEVGAADPGEAVREQVERGLDWIKLYPGGAYACLATGEAKYVMTYPLPVLQALLDEAGRHGRKTACHVLAGEGQKNAIVADCDTVE